MGKRCCGCMKIKQNSPYCEHCGWDERKQNESHQLPVGTVLENKYVVGRVLGQGGFGITYIGWDTMLDIPVAIKEYFPTGLVMRESTVSTQVSAYGGSADRFRESRERFLREAKALARFSAVPQIVHIYNFFQANNTAYIIMEYVEGITLRDRVLKKGPLSQNQVLSILSPVMTALEQLHNAGIIHRDISPDNIMLLPGGGAKLLDFGAVRDVSGAVPGEDASKSTTAIMKRGYAPIEQYRGKGDMGPWTDVYALCATICFCLTGQTPPDAPERMMAHMGGEDDGLHFEKIAPGNPRLQKALEHGMAHLAVDRTRSVRQLVAELDPHVTVFAQEAEKPRHKPVRHPPEPPKKKKLWWIPLALAAAVLIIFLLPANPNPPDPPVDPMAKETIPDFETVPEEVVMPEETIPATTQLPQESIPEETDAPVMIVPDDGTSQDAAEAQSAVLAPVFWPKDYFYDNGGVKSEKAGEERVFGTAIKRNAVESITFVSSLQDAPSGAADASEGKDGSVMAWSEGNHVYIAAEGGVYAPKDSRYLFAAMKNLKTIAFNGAFHTEDVSNMDQMFDSCSSLTELKGIGSWDTSAVTSMYRMFFSCEAMTEFPEIGSWDVASVTDMGEMFRYCVSLKELSADGWNTSSVKNMNSMFADCEKLGNLSAGSWDVSSVTDMSYMFYGCKNLRKLSVGSWNTVSVTDMGSMFQDCETLRELSAGQWNTSSVIDMSEMFRGCSSLKTVTIDNWDTSSVKDMSNMFLYCGKLRNHPVGGWDISCVTSYSGFADEGDTINGRPWQEYFQ